MSTEIAPVKGMEELPPMTDSGKRLFQHGVALSSPGRCRNCLVWTPLAILAATRGYCTQCNGFDPAEMTGKGCAECGHPSSHYSDCGLVA